MCTIMAGVGNGLDVLLLCYDEELQPWQKAVFDKHREAERKHEEDLKNYKEDLKRFYAGLGVSYNKKNGEASTMEQQVSESNSGVTRLVTTLPVTQSPIAHPIGAPPAKSAVSSKSVVSTQPVSKIVTPIMNAPTPVVKQIQPKQYQSYRPSPQGSKPSPVITAVKPFSKVTMQPSKSTTTIVPSALPGKLPLNQLPQPPAKRSIEEHAASSSAKRQALENGSKTDKHYGFKRGKTLVNEDGDRKFRIKCFHCDSVLPNNVLYMEHIQGYLDASRQSMKDSHLFCQYCFKRFKSSSDLESHFELYHSTVNKYFCKICDYSFKSKSVLKSHLQGVHDPLSMPYVCKVCHYRTSVYQDVMHHFKTVHKGAKALLCPYCCKILRCSRSYLQHCQRHYAVLLKNHGNFNCPCCKLQFLSSTERNEHVQTDHKKLKVNDKDGIPPYKATIFTKPPKPKVVLKKPKAIPIDVPVPARTRSDKVKPLMECLECGGGYDNLKKHLHMRMRCSSCSYVTFCGAAFAQHTIVFHSSFKAPPKVHPVKKDVHNGQPRLTCKKCGFATSVSPVMAWHTVSCTKGASSCESFVYLKLRQRKLFDMGDDGDKEVIEILSDGE